ncbi:MAG: 50S ribosomal protein L35 [Bacteroidetes bacterium]|nr:50S ribosomal protein L35 [Bacteroidota bacterium]MCL5026669.1 50S ribosomal protein L35 [Chloroflexota bacterium]
MPKYKLKTHSGTAKRFHITGAGKILRTKGMKSHLRRKKSDRVKRLFDEMIATSPTVQKRLRRLLPYGA